MATSDRSSVHERPRHANEPGRVAIDHVTVVPDEESEPDED